MASRLFLTDVETKWLINHLKNCDADNSLSIRAKLAKIGVKQESDLSIFDDSSTSTSTTNNLISDRKSIDKLEQILNKIINDAILTNDEKEYYYSQTGIRI